MTLKCFISGWPLKGKRRKCPAERWRENIVEQRERLVWEWLQTVPWLSCTFFDIVLWTVRQLPRSYVCLWLFTADGACFFFPLQSELAVLAKLPPLSERRQSPILPLCRRQRRSQMRGTPAEVAGFGPVPRMVVSASCCSSLLCCDRLRNTEGITTW